MIHAIVISKVKDFGDWLPVFQGHASERLEAGCTGANVFRSVSDPNDVHIVFGWSTAEALNLFMTNPKVQQMMAAAGTIGAPAVTLVDEIGNYAS